MNVDDASGPETPKDDVAALRARAREIGVPSTQRHIFLCTGPDCCTPEQGAASWGHLKARLKQLFPDLEHSPVYRTKAGCLRMCEQGPIAVVYPEGTWYRRLTPENLDRVVAEHLVAGCPVADLVFERCTLREGPAAPPPGSA